MPRVGEYDLGQTIGKGAYSKVKLCTHVPTGTEYVAKIVPKSNKDVEIEIRVEIGILRRLKHTNIVQLIEILESPRNYYIILEAVRGGDLCDLIISQKVGFPEPDACKFFNQVLKGLRACHEAGVAHRDLKPENLLLTPDRVIKISDFGLSRLHKESHGEAAPNELAQTLTGTLAYVAPEVLVGPYDAFKADAWSLGCILYVMLTCRFPFGSATDSELEVKIKKGTIVPLPETFSPEVRDLVNGLICKDVGRRLTLADITDHPWLQLANSPKPVKPTNARMGLPPIKVDKTSVDTTFMDVDDPSSPMASPKFAKPTRPKLC
eukprot:PhF_6_TR11283/c0_g1_i1/m.18209/K07198/PRKAA, AMPK; 5'-AMP-activated protein kinase, catalytic alpha subunit